MPSNLQTKVAEITNFLSSNPTPAEAGEYVQHNMGYLSDMVQGAKKVVKDYRTNIAEGYRNRVSPEDFQRATGDYGLGKSAPAPEQPAPTPHGSSGGFGDEAIGSPAGKQVVKKQHNDQTKQTKYFYNDGSSKVVEGLE